MNDHRDAEASRLTIDYRNAMAAAVGPAHGVTDAMLDEIAPVVAEQHARLSAEHAAGGQRWMDLPSDTALVAEIEAFAAEARARYRGFHSGRHRRLVARRHRHRPGAGASVS